MSLQIIENQTLDEERALYALKNALVKNCNFDGPADGESAFKECNNVEVEDCFLNLRYPFWHDNYLNIKNCTLTELCRAALWYSNHVNVSDSKLHGIKAFRECDNVHIDNCDIISPEFGWSTNNFTIENSTAVSEYFLMRSENIKFKNVNFKGKYSFQYIRNAVFEDCVFDTKDAFWHGKNITVINSVVKGEYLAWYSDHLTFINCKISGTQPLCYCTNLKLINCEMIDTDLSFERSEVEADITSPVVSVKNPLQGYINAPEIGEIIIDIEEAKEAGCKITTN